ncbi:MAG: nucleotidyltransferase family protein [Anaerolineae bacterium]|nr:nucleotidyltransferase family protein [Anaerolineae bacterium]
MPEIDDLLKQQRDAILRIAARHGARNVRVFGSVAKGTAGPQSDIDLLVEFDPDRSLMDVGRLIMDLRDLLGCEVDVVTEKGLHYLIRDEVLQDAVPL